MFKIMPLYVFFSFLLLTNSLNLNGQNTYSLFEGFQTNWESNWEKYSFTLEENTSTIKRYDDNNILKVVSNDSATGYWRDLNIKTQKSTKLSWYWRTNTILKDINQKSKFGDDYVGRMYVIFNNSTSFFDPNLKAICYVWGANLSQYEKFNSPYSENIKIIVLKNNRSKINTWFKENRNLYNDFEDAFGEPPSNISGVAFMVDTDNSDSNCTTWFDNISLN